MRIKLELTGNDQVILKKGFIKQLQALIYNLLERDSATWLHDNGFEYEKRRFKMFTFSSILEKGEYDKSNGKFIFPEKISLYVSSPVNWILEQVAENFVKKDQCILGDNILTIKAISVLKRPILNNHVVKIKALTPISTRTTDIKTKKYKTHSPFDAKFSELINKNLQKKWKSLYGRECEYTLSIIPLFDDEKKYKQVVAYGVDEDPRQTFIEGWKGRYLLKGNREFLHFAYDVGLGERNSQGFGMIEVVNGK